MTGHHDTTHEAPPVGEAVDRGAVEAIVSAAHGDPFSILGPHEVAPGVWDIRAFIPWGDEVELLAYHSDDVVAPFQSVHPAGLRVARLEAPERPGYRIRITKDGFGHVVDDPYAFGSALADYDIAAITHSNDTVFYYIFGAHPIRHGNVEGMRFVVWAPSARNVSVIGDFNDWDGRRHPMRTHSDVGVWEIFIPGVAVGARYKFQIKGPNGETVPEKADPVAFQAEHPPLTASVAHGLPRYDWQDLDWMTKRGAVDDRAKPISIYECHLGSWRRMPEEGNRRLTYRELADTLVPYCRDMGFTHIEMLPITEFPFDGSWGYQPVSMFAPTSRFGTPEDFSYFVDKTHEAGLGLILDWVPRISPTMRTASPPSMARISTSMPIPARASTRIGAPTSTIAGAARCRRSLSPTHASGSTNITLTACAWMRWPRCSTSTIRARRTSGCPTNTAATRISKRSPSCAR